MAPLVVGKYGGRDEEDDEDADMEQVGAPHQLALAQELAGAGLPQVGRILASDYGHDAASQAIRQFSVTIQENSKKGKLDILRENSRGEPQVYCVPRHTNFGA